MKFIEILHGLKAASFYYTDRTVTQEEADRRLAICADCDGLVEASDAWQKAACLVGGGKHCCTVCDCSINLLCNTLEELLPVEEEDQVLERKQLGCWRKS